MKLTGSSNEHPTKLSRVRDRVREMEVSKKPLAAGDYMFMAHGRLIGIEVKWSIADLTQSMQQVGEKTGTRLGIEVRKLTTVCDIGILVVPPLRDRGDGKLQYDPGAPVNDRAWEYNSVKGIMSDCSLYGVIVDEWDGDIAQRIAQWYYVTCKESHDWIKQRGRPEFITLDPTYHEAVWMLCAAYGWGPEAAGAALKQYGSVRAVINAGAKELQKTVKGVGPIMASHLEDIVTTDFR